MRFPFGDLIFYCFPKNIQKHENAISITFLIKSIMNKKLFSWKALAGLALLVAMGLTSCKQDNAVTLDENGNYKLPEKPVTPTASGTALKNFKTVAELNTLIAGTKDITDNIKAGGSVTITLDCSLLEAAAGDKIIIPGKTDATINLVFANKAKKNGGLVIADDALDVVTVTFPDGEFGDVAFEMPYSNLTLASAGASTLGKTAFKINKNDVQGISATIGNGITIKSIKNWDNTDLYEPIVVKDGATIESLYVDADYFTTVNGWLGTNAGNGFSLKGLTTDLNNGDEIFVDNLYIAEDATIDCYQNKKKNVANNITIAEGVTLTLNGAFANEIVGEGKGAIVDFGNTIWDMMNAGAYTNVALDGNNNTFGGSNDPVETIFTNCTLDNFNGLYLSQESATGLVFKSATDVYYPVYASATDDSYTYTFTKCEFAAGTDVYAFAEGVNILDKDGKPIKQTLYAYGWDDPDDDPDQGWINKSGIEKLSDIPEAVRKGETGYYYSYLYEPRTYDFTDLALIPAFSECKYNGAAVSEKNVTNFLTFNSLWGINDTAVATTTQVKIGDKTYKIVYSKNNGYVLVEQ